MFSLLCYTRFSVKSRFRSGIPPVLPLAVLSYWSHQLRTLQRRIKTWRALEGPAKEVFFPQRHQPGQLCQKVFPPSYAIDGRPEHQVGDGDKTTISVLLDSVTSASEPR